MVRTRGKHFRYRLHGRDGAESYSVTESVCNHRESDEDHYEVLDQPGHSLKEKVQRNKELKETKEAKKARQEYFK